MDFIDPALLAYSESFSTPEPAVLEELNRETHLKVLYPRMLSGHLQGRMLSMFSKMLRPKRILEIGTYTGYSAICMAEGLVEGGKLITLDINAELEEMVTRYAEKAGFADKIEMRIGDAREIVPGLDEEFDLVFLDADKGSYTHYFDLVLPKMPSGGMIIADNILWSGRVLNPKENDKETRGLKNFAEHVAKCEKVEQVLMPVRDGIMLIRKK